MVSSNKNKKRNKKNKNKRKSKKIHATDNSAQNPEKDVESQEENDNEHDDLKPHASKRSFNDDDSDATDQPKRKKKKKLTVPSDGTESKGKKSIRQMKREKHAQRMAEEAAASKDQLKSQCLSYLSQWKHNRQNWKFMKIKQVWLYKNKFSSNLLPDSSWPTFLEYFESAQGNIRKMLIEDANKVIKQMDEWTESQNKTEDKTNEDNDDNGENENGLKKPDDTAYKRARDILQCLQE